MKSKIVLLPLDERPCNYYFPQKLFSHDDIDIVLPKKLGDKKVPADLNEIDKFLTSECKDATGLIISLDTLLYGGLVPSRIHNENEEKLKERLDILREIRKDNPRLIIYAFNIIMRCPNYSSSDEEPDYYENYGREIHEIGAAMHRSHLGIENILPLEEIIEKVPERYLNDYISRRKVNKALNLASLELVKDKTVDTLVVPQDDSCKYGYAAIDQREIRKAIIKNCLEDKVLMYPGADEVELTLMSRMINVLKGKKPKVYIKYATDAARSIIPLYEGNMLSGTLKYHVLSAGCQLTESYEMADIIMAVTAPASNMEEAVNQPSKYPEYYAERNIAEMFDFIKDRLTEGKIVTIADNAYANGGDLQIIRLLNSNNLLMKVDGYAGWNTSANTVGTAIAEAVDSYHFEFTQKHQNFLGLRYIEDAGYCSVVRQQVANELEKYEMNYFDVKEKDGIISKIVKERLEEFIKNELSSISDNLQISKLIMPWRRMFEADIDVSYKL
nr:DUF4127 family protein [uncultured Catonella sp.]